MRTARTPWARLVGLMGGRRLEPGAALVFPDRRQIPTSFVFMPIDVCFYGADGTVERIVHGLRPWRISPYVRRAAGVLELPAGTLSARRCRGTGCASPSGNAVIVRRSGRQRR
ncbi:MAG TPA: DUF192 domain-containing protein [Chloroflexota bacterium]|nr:DUF192 domain-containing protein [Chloroflexota bacterium]